MINLKADNRQLFQGAKFSFLSANYNSGTDNFVLINSSGFEVNDFIFVENLALEISEIFQISGVVHSTNTINLLSLGNSTSQFDITNPSGTTFRYTWDGTGTNPNISLHVVAGMVLTIAAQNFNANNNGTFAITAVGTNYFEITNASGVAETNKTIGTGSIKQKTRFAHVQDTKVTVIKYNQVRFYYTTTATFSSSIPLATIGIQPDDFYTKYADSSNTTGFGWFIFLNSYSGANSKTSNAIPYAGFSEGSVKRIMDDFYSLLNNKEIKLVSTREAFSFLNAGYAQALNALNQVNPEYTIPSVYSISITASIAEYTVPSDFGQAVSLSDSNGKDIPYIDMQNVRYHLATASVSEVRHYLRGKYIGIVPTPTGAATYYLYYKAKAATLSSYYDDIDLPNNNYYFLIDYMLYRAGPKLKRSLTETAMYKKSFMDGIMELKLTAYKQNLNNDSWEISDEINV